MISCIVVFIYSFFICSLFPISHSIPFDSFDNAVNKCPCNYADSCDIVPRPKDKKLVVGFMTELGYNFYRYYQWYRLTTLVLPLDDHEFLQDLVCFAHQNKVSVLLRVDPTLEVVLNNSLHNQWADDVIKKVQKLYLDGINFDFQGPLDFDHSSFYTNLVNYTCSSLLVANKQYQCTLNMPWSGDCIDGRCYDVYEIAKFVAYIIVLSFSVQDEDVGPGCYARANSPFYRGLGAVVVYAEAGVGLDQIVVAMPWFGYMYQCVSVENDTLCAIKKRDNKPFCSDFVGKKLFYKEFAKLLNDPNSHAVPHWNSSYRSPYIMIEDGKSTQQGWFDNAKSLSLKIIAVKGMDLGGVGVYHMDCLNYTHNVQVNDMWGTLDLINGDPQ